MSHSLPTRLFAIVVFVACIVAPVYVAQEEARPPAQPAQRDPVWKRMVTLSDGRTFVTDGSFALDAALAKPAARPSEVLPAATAKVIEGHLLAPLPDEFALAQLTGGRRSMYTAPSGIVLNAVYVDYLRRTLPASKLRFRMKGDLEPTVVLLNGTAVGLLMPMKR
jgi:hypothetical protein